MFRRPAANWVANATVRARESHATRFDGASTRVTLAVPKTSTPVPRARTGWRRRRRRNAWASGERSCASPSRSVRTGKSVSPSAAIAPLAPRVSTARSEAPTSAFTTARWREGVARETGAASPGAGSSGERLCAVRTRAPRSRKVFDRCRIMETPRFIEASWATSSKSTRPAPMSASPKISAVATTDVRRET